MNSTVDVRQRMDRLKGFLGQKEYKVFAVNPNKSKGDDDILVVDTHHPTTPLWLYTGPKGLIVIRPWVGAFQSRQLRNAVPAGHRRGLRMMRSRPMPPVADWRDYLSNQARIQLALEELTE